MRWIKQHVHTSSSVLSVHLVWTQKENDTFSLGLVKNDSVIGKTEHQNTKKTL